jgi:hypothetical protein
MIGLKLLGSGLFTLVIMIGVAACMDDEPEESTKQILGLFVLFGLVTFVLGGFLAIWGV